LGVGRTHVRDAIAKLEFYGLLKTMPQSGTVVEGIGITALEGLISDVLKLEDSEFADLVETRVLLETQAARMAAQRRTTDDIINMKNALDAYESKVKNGLPAVEEDLLFHLTIAEAGRNTVLKSLMLIITPDIVKSFQKLDVCKDGRFYRSLDEHKIILDHIVNQQPELAARAMAEHLQDVTEYSKTVGTIEK
ncbi:MAG: FCD domain-containing protein, partial [Bacteroidota bacterium]